MMCTEQYALRWNNYSSHISGAFDSLRHDDNLVDVTLSCDGGKIRAHKIMLSACSPYFRDLFKENPCQHPIVILRNVNYSDLSAIISFMYQGEVNVISDQLTSFLQTAEMLEVRGLTDSGRDSPELQSKNDEDKMEENIQQVNQLEEKTSEKLATGKKRKVAEDTKNKVLDNSKKSFNPPSPNKSTTTYENETYSNDIAEELIDVSELQQKTNFIPGRTATVTATATATYKGKDDYETVKAEQTTTAESSQTTNSSAGPSTTTTTPSAAEQDDLKSSGADEDELLFRCRLCWKGFKHPMSLTLHRDAHEGKTECPVCRRHFSRSYDMRSHLTRIHKMTLSLDAKLDFCEDK